MSVGAVGPRYDTVEPMGNSTAKEGQTDNSILDWAVERNDEMSELFGKEVTHADFLVIFFELLKMSIKDRENFLISRREERRLQTAHILEVAKNYQSQGAWLKASGIASGICNLISAVCPVLSHTAGKDIVGFLGTYFERFKGMEADTFFRTAGKLLQSTSKIQEMTSQVHNMYSEGDRVKDYHLSEIHKSDYDQRSQDIQLLLQHFREIEDALASVIRTDYETAIALYRTR